MVEIPLRIGEGDYACNFGRDGKRLYVTFMTVVSFSLQHRSWIIRNFKSLSLSREIFEVNEEQTFPRIEQAHFLA